MYPKIFFFVNLPHPLRHRNADEIPTARVSDIVYRGAESRSPEFHINALVTFVLFLDVLEQEIERLGLPHLAWRGELL